MSKPGRPLGPPTRKLMSFARGTAFTPASCPAGVIAIIVSDAGSMNIAESPWKLKRPPPRAP